MDFKQNQTLHFIHFNDVYNIEPSMPEPIGGSARFVTMIQQIKQKYQDCLVLFSGDLFAPSILSSLYGGKQMIEPINSMEVNVACYGNHELDYNLEEIENLVSQTNFPWLMSNVYNNITNKNLCDALSKHIIEQSGFKIGFIGLAEEEWLGLITEIDINIIGYEDFITCAKRLTNELLYQDNCNLIIALTHMRIPNDIKLAEQVPEIDLILGGHDHAIELRQVNQSVIIKSGSDFKQLSINSLELIHDQEQLNKINPTSLQMKGDNIIKFKNKFKLTTNFIEINSSINPDPDTQEHCDFYKKLCAQEMEKTIGYSLCDIETRFCELRSKETNFSNLFADIIKLELQADVSLINTGTIRSDCIFPKGKITFAMLNKMLPIQDTMVCLELSGEVLYQALENGVSKYPSLDGRFPAVSGIKFKFDPTNPPGSRIPRNSIFINNEQIKFDKKYHVAMKEFLALGKDGYEMFINQKFIVDPDNGMPHLACMKNFFDSYKRHSMTLRKFGSQEQKKNSMMKSYSLQQMNSSSQPDLQFIKNKNQENNFSKFEMYKEKGLIKDITLEKDGNFITINPIVEGRIQLIE